MAPAVQDALAASKAVLKHAGHTSKDTIKKISFWVGLITTVTAALQTGLSQYPSVVKSEIFGYLMLVIGTFQMCARYIQSWFEARAREATEEESDAPAASGPGG